MRCSLVLILSCVACGPHIPLFDPQPVSGAEGSSGGNGAAGTFDAGSAGDPATAGSTNAGAGTSGSTNGGAGGNANVRAGNANGSGAGGIANDGGGASGTGGASAIDCNDLKEGQACLLDDFETNQPNLQFSWIDHPWAPGAIIERTASGCYAGHCLHMGNPQPNDSRTTVNFPIDPQGHYTLSGMSRGLGIVYDPENNSPYPINQGACLYAGEEYEKSSYQGFGTFDWRELSITFDGNAAGTIRTGPRLGYYFSRVSGEAWFDELRIERLMGTKNDKVSIFLESKEQHSITTADLTAWGKQLSDVWASFQAVGGDAFPAQPRAEVVSSRQTPGVMAKHKGIVYFNREALEVQLVTLPRIHDWSYPLLNEMSKAFTMECSTCFSKTSIAKLILFYAISTLQAKVSPDGKTMYVGDEILTYFNTMKSAEDKLGYRLALIAREIGWNIVTSALSSMNALANDSLPATGSARFDLFVKKLSDASQRDVRAKFQPDELAFAAQLQ